MLPKGKGLNRFVWDMRYQTMVGVPNVRIEGGFAAHKAPRDVQCHVENGRADSLN